MIRIPKLRFPEDLKRIPRRNIFLLILCCSVFFLLIIESCFFLEGKSVFRAINNLILIGNKLIPYALIIIFGSILSYLTFLFLRFYFMPDKVIKNKVINTGMLIIFISLFVGIGFGSYVESNNPVNTELCFINIKYEVNNNNYFTYDSKEKGLSCTLKLLKDNTEISIEKIQYEEESLYDKYLHFYINIDTLKGNLINTKDIDSIDVYRYYPNYEKRTFSIAYENIYNSSKINNDKIVFDNSSIHIKLNQDIFNPNNYSYLYIKIKFKRNMNFDLEKDYLLRAFSYHYPYSILWDSDFELRNKSNDIESLIGGAKIADYENFQTTDISLYNKNRDRINLFLGILFSAFIGTLSSIFIVSLVGDKINFFKK